MLYPLIGGDDHNDLLLPLFPAAAPTQS